MRSIATPARCSGRGTDPWPFARTRSSSSSPRRSHRCSSRASWCWRRVRRLGAEPFVGAGPVGLAGFLIFGMRYYYVALTDRRLIFLNASFWTSRPKGFAWADPRESITTSDLQTDNKLWNWGKISSPTQAEPPDDLPRVLAPRAQGDGRHVGRPDRRIRFRPPAGRHPSCRRPRLRPRLRPLRRRRHLLRLHPSPAADGWAGRPLRAQESTDTSSCARTHLRSLPGASTMRHV